MQPVETIPDLDRVPQTGEPAAAHIVKTEPGESAAAKVLEARIYGTPLEALCGHVWVPSRDPKQLPICEDCKGDLRDVPRLQRRVERPPRRVSVSGSRDVAGLRIRAAARARAAGARTVACCSCGSTSPTGTRWALPGGGIDPGETAEDVPAARAARGGGARRSARSARTCGRGCTSSRSSTDATTASASRSTSCRVADRFEPRPALTLGAAQRRARLRRAVVDAGRDRGEPRGVRPGGDGILAARARRPRTAPGARRRGHLSRGRVDVLFSMDAWPGIADGVDHADVPHMEAPAGEAGRPLPGRRDVDRGARRGPGAAGSITDDDARRSGAADRGRSARAGWASPRTRRSGGSSSATSARRPGRAASAADHRRRDRRR